MSKVREMVMSIRFITSIKKITQAMKMVSAAKLNRLNSKYTHVNEYFYEISRISELLLTNPDDIQNVPIVNKCLVIVLTSDKGLCGAFNGRVIKGAMSEIAKFENKDIDILPIGRKGFDFFKKRQSNVIDTYHNLFANLSFSAVSNLVDFLLEAFKNNVYSVVKIVYNGPKSLYNGDVNIKEFSSSFLHKLDDKPEVFRQGLLYIYEPDKATIYNDLLVHLLKIRFYSIFLESNFIENKFRMLAMGKATDNAEELIKNLKIKYNKARQSMITREISEIISGFESIKP
jgi:F-type H+-transporting ATPase subunit gamma